MKRGIAISLYDKFDELSILHDIIRHNFKNQYSLYVCSNHPDAENEISKRKLVIDGFIQGENIEYSSQMNSHEKRLSLVCRSTDTVQKSCTLAMQNCESVMHIHCDAWPLDEDKLIEHFRLVEENDYSIAVRGLGWSYYAQDRPLGGIDDHFFVFNSKKILENNIFDFDILEMLPHMLTIHGILGLQILSKIGLKRTLYYDNFTSHECWDGEKKIFPSFPVKPSLIDQERQFLHVHRESFPDNLGCYLQTFYLIKNGLVNGANIESHIRAYPYDENICFNLTQRLRNAEKKAKAYGVNIISLAQEIKVIETINLSLTLKDFIVNNSIKTIKQIIKKILKSKNLRIVKHDDIWPKKLDKYYLGLINKNYFKNRKDFWFE